ncbi:MAG TPA: hypothetical protein VJT75_15445 [Thermoleophilaceae bacterium]|nr:hypothetical protein [Thermoleophilaceae bacterium]
MASREEQKKKAREERERKQREEADAKKKRKRRIRILVGVGVVAVAAIIAFVLMSGGTEKQTALKRDKKNAQATPGPWNTGSEGLGERVKALGLPDPSDTVFHIHANLKIYTDGKPQKVPQNVGIDEGSQFITSLHTHTDDGTIHMEAVQPYPFKLGQFFAVWNVPFSSTQIGSYHVGKGLELQTWVNGNRLKTDPTQYVMKAHDKIVIGFGKPGSFPTKNNFKFPAGE